MEIPMTPSQAAAVLGVAPVTIYKWIEAKKLPAHAVQAGSQTRIYLSREAVELKRAELESQKIHNYEDLQPAAEAHMKWVMLFRELMGKMPPLYLAFRRGAVTFEAMKAEAIRRFDALR